MINHKKIKKYYFGIILIGFTILARLLPHLPNATPLSAVSTFASAYLGKKNAYYIILLSLIISDICLAYQNQYPIFGTWSLFTYSGLVLIVSLNSIFRSRSIIIMLLTTLSKSLLFWIWTNLGVWILDNMYSFDLKGIWTCYKAALPFLKNSIIGEQVWLVLLLIGFGILSKTYYIQYLNTELSKLKKKFDRFSIEKISRKRIKNLTSNSLSKKYY